MFCVPGLIFGDTQSVRSPFLVLRYRTHFRRYRGSRVPFSCFMRPDSFSAIPRVSGLVFMFCAPVHFFGGTEGVKSHFPVLRARTSFRQYRGHRVPFSFFCSLTRFRRYRGRRVPFSCFLLPDSFSAVPGCRVQFSCFALPDSFSTVPWVLDPVFMFCAPGLVFGDTRGVRSHFHVLRVQTRFRRYQGRVLFSWFALPNSFSTVPMASGPLFMFCAPGLVSAVPWASGPVFTFFASGLVFDDTGASSLVFFFCAPGLIFGRSRGVGSCFHVWRYRTHIWRNRGSRDPCSCFARPESFSAILRESGPVFLFGAAILIFGGTKGVGSRFHVLRARTHFRRYRGHRVSFHVLRSRTRFRR
jgi:hypothetical protein